MGEQAVPFMGQVTDIVIQHFFPVTQIAVAVVIYREITLRAFIRVYSHVKHCHSRRAALFGYHIGNHTGQVGDKTGRPLDIFCRNGFSFFQKGQLPQDCSFMDACFIMNDDVFQTPQGMDFK